MSTVKFKMDDTLKSIIAHAQAATEFSPGYGPKAFPSLFLVKDDGIYLMSAAKEAQRIEADKPNCVVAYAVGFNPKTDEDVWERARDAVGGDDFGEALKLEGFVEAMNDGASEIHLNVSATHIRMTSIYPRPANSINSNPSGGMSFVGKDAVNVYAATALASALRLYAKSGMKVNRAYTPKAMIAKANEITGKKFKARDYEGAAAALTAWANATAETINKANAQPVT